MSRTGDIDPAVLDQAAAWLVRLNAADADSGDRCAWQQWHDEDPEHARAWKRAEALLVRLSSLPQILARPVLERDHDALRRHVVTRAAIMLTLVPLAWSTWQHGPEWAADYRTAIGERKSMKLTDGSEVMLNTASALNVRFDERQRLLRLVAGEILIDTAPDPLMPSRPFIVDSAQGRMRALGTRFMVRQRNGQTELAVLQGTVEIRTRDGHQPVLVHAGEKTNFNHMQIDSPQAVVAHEAAWSRGMLVADGLPLQFLAEELSRYRRGVIHVDSALAQLPVSGAFPIDDTERSLSMLQTTYPLKLEFVTRYWVRLAAK